MRGGVRQPDGLHAPAAEGKGPRVASVEGAAIRVGGVGEGDGLAREGVGGGQRCRRRGAVAVCAGIVATVGEGIGVIPAVGPAVVAGAVANNVALHCITVVFAVQLVVVRLAVSAAHVAGRQVQIRVWHLATARTASPTRAELRPLVRVRVCGSTDSIPRATPAIVRGAMALSFTIAMPFTLALSARRAVATSGIPHTGLASVRIAGRRRRQVRQLRKRHAPRVVRGEHGAHVRVLAPTARSERRDGRHSNVAVSVFVVGRHIGAVRTKRRAVRATERPAGGSTPRARRHTVGALWLRRARRRPAERRLQRAAGYRTLWPHRSSLTSSSGRGHVCGFTETVEVRVWVLALG